MVKIFSMAIKQFGKKNKAFTLIEALLYISLFVVIFSTLFVSLNAFYSNKIKNRSVAEVEHQGQLISLIVSQEIRNAQSIVSPLSGSSAPSLSLEHFSASKNPLSFYLLDDQMVVKEGGSVFALSNSRVRVSNLSFENKVTSGEIKTIIFSFDVDYKSNSNRSEYKYHQSFSGQASLLKK